MLPAQKSGKTLPNGLPKMAHKLRVKCILPSLASLQRSPDFSRGWKKPSRKKIGFGKLFSTWVEKIPWLTALSQPRRKITWKSVIVWGLKPSPRGVKNLIPSHQWCILCPGSELLTSQAQFKPWCSGVNNSLVTTLHHWPPRASRSVSEVYTWNTLPTDLGCTLGIHFQAGRCVNRCTTSVPLILHLDNSVYQKSSTPQSRCTLLLALG